MEVVSLYHETKSGVRLLISCRTVATRFFENALTVRQHLAIDILPFCYRDLMCLSEISSLRMKSRRLRPEQPDFHVPYLPKSRFVKVCSPEALEAKPIQASSASGVSDSAVATGSAGRLGDGWKRLPSYNVEGEEFDGEGEASLSLNRRQAEHIGHAGRKNVLGLLHDSRTFSITLCDCRYLILHHYMHICMGSRL